MITDFESKMRKAVGDIETYGKEYAVKKAVSWQLQEMRKVVLAEMIRAQNTTLSYADRETFARCSPEYKTHLEGTKEAIQNELTAKAMVEKSQAAYECLRSLCSLYNAQSRIGE